MDECPHTHTQSHRNSPACESTNLRAPPCLPTTGEAAGPVSRRMEEGKSRRQDYFERKEKQVHRGVVIDFCVCPPPLHRLSSQASVRPATWPHGALPAALATARHMATPSNDLSYYLFIHPLFLSCVQIDANKIWGRTISVTVCVFVYVCNVCCSWSTCRSLQVNCACVGQRVRMRDTFRGHWLVPQRVSKT